MTPIEQYDDWFFKREDHFTIDECNGTKARFIYDTLQFNLDKIKGEFDNSVKVFNSPGSHSLYTTQIICRKLGLELVAVEDREEFVKTNAFPMYQRISTPTLFRYTEVLNQVENIPSDLDSFVISCGSCQTLYAVLLGFKKFCNKPKRIIAIGNKAANALCEDLNKEFNVEFYNRNKFTYPIVDSPFEMDTVHELQAWSFLHKYLEIKGKKLFWVTGNYNFLRNKQNDPS